MHGARGTPIDGDPDDFLQGGLPCSSAFLWLSVPPVDMPHGGETYAFRDGRGNPAAASPRKKATFHRPRPC